MAGVAAVNPKQQFLDSEGVPLAGGFVYTYLAGTTALTSSWADRALTTANTNPIELDASGSCTIWLDSDVTYKIVVTDSAGVTQSHLGADNVVGAAGPSFLAAIEAAVTTATADITALVDESEAARDSLLAAASVYADTTAGLAATASGGYFWVPSAEDDESYILYKDNAGVAEEVKRLPSATAYTTLSGQVTGLAANFTLMTSDNIYDPDIVGSADNSVYQLNGAVGAISGYHRSGPIPVTAGQEIVIDLTNTDASWTVYKPSGNSVIHGYTSTTPGVGTLDETITGTWSQGDRLVTLTVPTGTSYIGFSAVGFSSPSADDFATLRERTMVYVGTTQIDYAPYYPANTYEPVEDDTDEDDPVALVKSGTSIYIRQPFNATYDIVRRIEAGVAPSTSEHGTVDFIGVRKIAKTARLEDTRYAYDAATSTDRLLGNTDNGPPEKLNSMYLGGGHGVSATWKLQKTAHGLTAADVGDVGADSAVKSWVLVRVVDADNILVTAANTGTATKWIISGSPPAAPSTITFASAGAFDYTVRTATQAWPLAQDYAHSLWIDGTQITADGAYRGQRAELREEYGIPNPADWLSTLIAEKGAVTPKNPSDSSIDTHVELNVSWQFDRYGAQVGYFDHYVAQEYGRSGGSTDDYWGAQQWQVISRQTGETVWQYVPDLAGSVGGYDFKSRANITSNAATVTLSKADCSDPTDPASHFAQFIKDGSSNPTFGFVHGFDRTIGIGVPATRASVVSEPWQLSTSEKQYIRAVDAGAGATASAGENYTAVTYNAFYDMSAAPDYTVNALYERADGKVVWVFDCHATLSGEWVIPGDDGVVPAELIGRPVTVLDSTNFTLHTDDVLTAKGLRVSTTSSYGRAVVEIG